MTLHQSMIGHHSPLGNDDSGSRNWGEVLQILMRSEKCWQH